MPIAVQWENAVATVRREYAALPASIRARLAELTAAIRFRKAAMAALTTGGESVCRACGGACCAHGRNHFTVVDLLAFLDAGTGLFTPVFDASICPYLSAQGCMMAPGFRPFNCIIFLCEEIDSSLPTSIRERLWAAEQELRRLYAELEQIFHNRFAHGLLITYERAHATGSGTLLNLTPHGVR